jgi:hypothetical protein
MKLELMKRWVIKSSNHYLRANRRKSDGRNIRHECRIGALRQLLDAYVSTWMVDLKSHWRHCNVSTLFDECKYNTCHKLALEGFKCPDLPLISNPLFRIGENQDSSEIHDATNIQVMIIRFFVGQGSHVKS